MIHWNPAKSIRKLFTKLNRTWEKCEVPSETAVRHPAQVQVPQAAVPAPRAVAPAVPRAVVPAVLQVVAPVAPRVVAPAVLRAVAPAVLRAVVPAVPRAVAPAVPRAVVPAVLQVVAPAALRAVLAMPPATRCATVARWKTGWNAGAKGTRNAGVAWGRSAM